MGCYRAGQYLGMHRDEPLQGGDASLLVYLSSAMEGGKTAFYSHTTAAEPHMRVTPEAGTAILFDISALHAAEPIASGTKCILGCELNAVLEHRHAEAAGEDVERARQDHQVVLARQ